MRSLNPFHEIIATRTAIQLQYQTPTQQHPSSSESTKTTPIILTETQVLTHTHIQGPTSSTREMGASTSTANGTYVTSQAVHTPQNEPRTIPSTADQLASLRTTTGRHSPPSRLSHLNSLSPSSSPPSPSYNQRPRARSMGATGQNPSPISNTNGNMSGAYTSQDNYSYSYSSRDSNSNRGTASLEAKRPIRCGYPHYEECFLEAEQNERSKAGSKRRRSSELQGNRRRSDQGRRRRRERLLEVLGVR